MELVLFLAGIALYAFIAGLVAILVYTKVYDNESDRLTASIWISAFWPVTGPFFGAIILVREFLLKD